MSSFMAQGVVSVINCSSKNRPNAEVERFVFDVSFESPRFCSVFRSAVKKTLRTRSEEMRNTFSSTVGSKGISGHGLSSSAAIKNRNELRKIKKPTPKCSEGSPTAAEIRHLENIVLFTKLFRKLYLLSSNIYFKTWN